jgi:NhaA family Na+:H+ antiporter
MKKTISLVLEFSVPLIAGVMIALVWANLAPESYHAVIDKPFAETHPFGRLSLHFLANELFMVLFFGMAAAEITQSCLPGGDLHPLRKAGNPLLSTLGGIVGPVVVYLALNSLFGSPELRRGLGIPVATDIVLAWLTARIVFGRGHPAVTFLLLLGIVDDAVGLAAITFLSPRQDIPVAPEWLPLVFFGMFCAWLMRKMKIRHYWPYLIIGGGLCWTGLFNAHLHPSLALVFVVPFIPLPKREKGHLYNADLADHSPMTDFELEWKNVVLVGLFIFGLANAGVEFSAVGTATWLVLVSLFVGKTGGIFLMARLGVRLGFPLPRTIGRKELLAVGMIAGIGLTVALLMAGRVFTDVGIREAAKMGALLSAVPAPIVVVFCRLLRVERVR